MNTKDNKLHSIAWIGVILLQLVMTQVVTFLAAFLARDIDTFPKEHPFLFILLLGMSFSTGAFAAGWLCIRWLPGEPRLPVRLIATLTGAFLPFSAVPWLKDGLMPGSPLFLISIILCILGFHSPIWLFPRKVSKQ